MGYDIRIFNFDGEGTKYSLIKDRAADLNFEVWVQSEGTADYNTYVLQQRSVLDVGALGVIGRSGWFIPVRAFRSLASFVCLFVCSFAPSSVVLICSGK